MTLIANALPAPHGARQRPARRVVPIILAWRRPLVILLHLLLVTVSNAAAFGLRFDGAVPSREGHLWLQFLPWLLAIRAMVFYPFGLFRGLWRYTSLWDARNILLGIGVSTMLFYVLVRGFAGIADYPRSVFLIDALLLAFLMVGVRLAHRMLPAARPRAAGRRILIIGAGDSAEMIVREMQRHREEGCEPIGFIENDPDLQGQRIHGVPVMGGLRDLVPIMLAERPDEVLLAFGRPEPAAVRAVVKLLEPFHVPLTRLPSLTDLVNGRARMTDVRELCVEDLLTRAPIGLDAAPIQAFIEGRRILVTGAGGSIGSELCRQIARWSPARLVLFERYEGGLYSIERELRDRMPHSPVAAVIGDVTDTARLNAVCRAERPDIIFHAAAHKHVPLMEMNPSEAVKNNVLGTLRVAQAALRHDVGHFVLISTDKAVRPSSVMGASKRIAEMIIQDLSQAGATCFVTVRFGNVLGSSGSVVPRFQEQIKEGGPVTVTHPDIRRYFMLIPEAVHLVLDAAAIGEPGAVYVLDMGEQIRLVDIARNLIRLSGHVPGEDIDIVFTGLRPGEKLSEELVGDDELADASSVSTILRIRTPSPRRPLLPRHELARLFEAARMGQEESVLALMHRLVPSFAVPSAVTREAASPEDALVRTSSSTRQAPR